MKDKYQQIIALLILIALISIILRFYKLTSLPPINRDEASIGYNAYSLLKTGRDEHGEKFPLSFKSFGDYKMPGVIYATILPVRIFDLNEFAVRFWSATGGIITIISLYYLAKWIFKNYGFNKKETHIWSTLPALFLMINPWHIFYSRVGFEANLNLTFLILGLTFFVYGLKKRPLLIFSSLCFVSMLYLYSSSFIFLPPFLLTLGIIFRKDLLKKKDIWLFLYVLVILIGTFYATKSVWQVSRAKQNITIFSDPGIIDSFNKTRSLNFATNPLVTRIWFNKYFFFSRIIFKNYLSTFSPNFLFLVGGSHPWHKIPGIGYFYLLDSLFIVLGLIFLLKNLKLKESKLLLGWFLLSPLPSAITIDAPHATRCLQLIPVWLILVSLGINKVFSKSHFWRIITIIGYLTSLLYFSHQYFVVYPKNLPQSLLPGIKQALQLIKEEKDKPVLFTDPVDSAYIYTAFYTKYDPTLFQKQALWAPADPAGLVHVSALGRFYFDQSLLPQGKSYLHLVQESSNQKPKTIDGKIVKDENSNVLWRIYQN